MRRHFERSEKSLLTLSLSVRDRFGVVTFPRLHTKKGFVIPAKAGIQANSAENKPGFPPARE
jgi:hypothetical protein